MSNPFTISHKQTNCKKEVVQLTEISGIIRG